MTNVAFHKRLNWAVFSFVTLIIIVLEAFPRIDFSISSWFYDAQTRTFPLASDVLWRDWLHHKLRYSLRPFQMLSVILWLASFFWEPLKKWRSTFLYFVLSSVVAAGLVAELKILTQRACPYQLTEFGGEATFYPLFSGVPEIPGNKCWPGGHVLHAFTLFPLYFIAWRHGMNKTAIGILIVVVAFGMLLNVTQIVRGHHFLSHNMWSMLIGWSVAMTFDRIWFSGLNNKSGKLGPILRSLPLMVAIAKSNEHESK